MGNPNTLTPLEPRPNAKDMTGEEAQAYVQKRWPSAYMHIHGPECTIIPVPYEERNKLKERGLPWQPPDVPFMLGRVLIPYKWTREQQKPREDYLWRLAAATCYEYEVSVRLRDEKQTG